MGCKTRKYSDGGKVLEREYSAGQPTYLKSILAKVGIGDGYGKKSPPKDKNADKRLTIASAPEKFGETLAKRKQMLDP